MCLLDRRLPRIDSAAGAGALKIESQPASEELTCARFYSDRLLLQYAPFSSSALFLCLLFSLLAAKLVLGDRHRRRRRRRRALCLLAYRQQQQQQQQHLPSGVQLQRLRTIIRIEVLAILPSFPTMHIQCSVAALSLSLSCSLSTNPSAPAVGG